MCQNHKKDCINYVIVCLIIVGGGERMDIYTLVIISILFGALVRTVFGFGEALVTMPILALLGVDLKLAIALVGIIGVLVAMPKFIANYKVVNWHIVKRLLIGSIIGTPLGIVLIIFIDENIVLTILGSLLVLYGVINLLGIKLMTKYNIKDKFDYVAGLFSGVLGSAYNSHGVPIVVYGTLKKWNIVKLKQISQVHFFIVGLVVITNHAVTGFWTMEMLYIIIATLPFLIIIIKLGDVIAEKIEQQILIKYVYLLLIIFGILMIVK